MLHDADHETAHDIDHENQDSRHRIATHKLACAIHGTVEIGFLRHFGASFLGFFLRENTGVEICIDRHLFAGHGVEGKARADFRNAASALSHHHKIDDHQNREHHQANRIVAPHHEFTKGLDHLTRRIMTRMSVEQDHACRGDVQRKPQQRRDQQYGRERRKIERPPAVNACEEHHQRQRDIEREQQVE